ncbi:transposase [Streptomyces sp. 8N706]|uniref:transposase n=1 Tax=Streptomyces sp. 8N706 TaxID=3457416 RepID=UPI003FD4A43E
MRGLLTDGQRKSVEPVAARLGEDGNRQALAHFVTSSPWDPAHADPARRTRDPAGDRRSGTARVLAAGRVARR